MSDISFLLYICIIIPMCLLLPLFKGKSKTIFISILVGLTICLISGQINSLIRDTFKIDEYSMTIVYTPIIEEILKAIPIIYVVLIFKPARQVLVEIAMAIGIGFAILENASIVGNSIDIATFSWVLIRGFGAGLMHGICTFSVGMGLTLAVNLKKTVITGTIAILALAMIYHSLFNVLIQSNYLYVGLLIPALTYLIIISYYVYSYKKGKSKNEKIENLKNH